MAMQVWIHINDCQEGPFAIEELPLDRMTLDTPVWHAGLTDWASAKDVPAVACLFAEQPQSDFMAEQPQSDNIGEQRAPFPHQRAPYPQWGPYPYQRPPYPAYGPWGPRRPMPHPRYPVAPKAPSMWLWVSIPVAILFFINIFALAAIVLGIISRQKYKAGNLPAAQKLSTACEWLLIVGITFGFVTLPFKLLG